MSAHYSQSAIDQNLLTPGSAEDQSISYYQTPTFASSSISSQPTADVAVPQKQSASLRTSIHDAEKDRAGNLWQRVTLRRAQVREFRDELRADREDLWELQNRFQEVLQKQWQGQEDVDKTLLDRLHKETEEAFERLGPNEAAFNEAEDDLRILEYKLQGLGRRLSASPRSRKSSEVTEDAARPFSPLSGLQQSDKSISSREDSSPRARYRVRKAEAQIASTRLQELADERLMLLEVEQNAGPTGPRLEAADVEFLANFDSRYQEQYNEVEALGQDLTALRLEAGSMISSETRKDEFDTADNSMPQSPESFPGRSPDRSRSFLVNLKRRSDGNQVHVDMRTTRQRVNQWVLEVLKASPVQRRMSEEFLQDPTLNNATWWHFVIRFQRINRLDPLKEEPKLASEDLYPSDDSEPDEHEDTPLEDSLRQLPPIFDPQLSDKPKDSQYDDAEPYPYYSFGHY